MTPRAPQIVAWATLVVVGALNGAGYLLDLWSTLWWYDDALHGLTSAGVTLVIGVYLAPAMSVRWPVERLVVVVLIASVGVALGAIWEIGEWGFDQVFTAGSAIPGKTDTIVDLILDTAGAVVAAVAAVALTDRSTGG